MHVSRIGFTPLKGTRHSAHDQVVLDASGPVGDRVFCLVDLERRRVLRSVENPELIAVRTAYEAGELSLAFPDGTSLSARPTDTGEELKGDYWGRPALLRLQGGPHAGPLSAYLGRQVTLARVGPGEVVYGAPVSVVTTGAVAELAARTGDARLGMQSARFRATFTLDTERDLTGLAAGARIHLGQTTLEVTGPIPRCTVLDRHPVTGIRDADVLAALARYGQEPGEIRFGLDARVVVPGVVHQGDPALVEG